METLMRSWFFACVGIAAFSTPALAKEARGVRERVAIRERVRQVCNIHPFRTKAPLSLRPSATSLAYMWHECRTNHPRSTENRA
jgi:hypothetical protein